MRIEVNAAVAKNMKALEDPEVLDKVLKVNMANHLANEILKILDSEIIERDTEEATIYSVAFNLLTTKELDIILGKIKNHNF